SRGLGVRRPRWAVRPRSERLKTRENDAHEEPEQQPCPQRPRRASEPDALAPAEREEIDGGDEERDEQRDQHELDRPAARDPLVEPDVARGPLRELEAAVQRAERLLRRLAELRELTVVQAPGGVPERRRRPAAGARQRDRRDPARDERALFVERERKAEVDQ